MRDFHIHPAYSIDAKGNAEDFVKAAIEKGLEEICFTTHIDLNPAREVIDFWMSPDGYPVKLTDELIDRYLDEIAQLSEKYCDSIKVNAGFEFSYAPSYENVIRKFLEKHPVVFTIGSVHCLENVGFTASFEANSVLRSYTPKSFLDKYAEYVIALAESRLFTTIGHIDGYKKYALKYWNMDELHAAEDIIFPGIFKKLVELDQGFELNTSARRKGHDEFYPSKRLLEIAKDFGAKVNSTGSDAHRPEQIAFMFDEIEGYMV